jgi:hypothetical protein
MGGEWHPDDAGWEEARSRKEGREMSDGVVNQGEVNPLGHLLADGDPGKPTLGEGAAKSTVLEGADGDEKLMSTVRLRGLAGRRDVSWLGSGFSLTILDETAEHGLVVEEPINLTGFVRVSGLDGWWEVIQIDHRVGVVGVRGEYGAERWAAFIEIVERGPDVFECGRLWGRLKGLEVVECLTCAGRGRTLHLTYDASGFHEMECRYCLGTGKRLRPARGETT